MGATTQSLGDSILREIPAAERLGFHLLEVGNGGARARVDFEPNMNHLGTFFGGNLYAAGALTCYAGLRALLDEHKLPSKNIVVARGDIVYIAPATGDIEVRSHVPAAEVRAFLDDFRSRRRGKLKIEAQIFDGLRLVAKVRAAYLARDEDAAS